MDLRRAASGLYYDNCILFQATQAEGGRGQANMCVCVCVCWAQGRCLALTKSERRRQRQWNLAASNFGIHALSLSLTHTHFYTHSHMWSKAFTCLSTSVFPNPCSRDRKCSPSSPDMLPQNINFSMFWA